MTKARPKRAAQPRLKTFWETVADERAEDLLIHAIRIIVSDQGSSPNKKRRRSQKGHLPEEG